MMTTRNDDLERLRLPELQQRYRAVLGEATRCPNRTFLVRRIREVLAASKTTKTATTTKPARGAKAVKTTQPKGARGAKTPRAKKSTEAITRHPRGHFSAMTVEELQAAYAHAVGRPTGSRDRPYLAWKIREAENGRVPIGPRATRTPDQEAQTDVKILPLRLGNDAVARIDAVWRNAGMPSRMEFFRRALVHFLKHLGQRDAAALFA